MDRPRSDGSSSSDRSKSTKGKEICQETWKDVRARRNQEETQSWLTEQRTKSQMEADFEKGLRSSEDAENYVKDYLGLEGSWRSHTDYSSEHKQREREIACLARLTEKSGSNKELLNSMQFASKEINSHSGYVHDYALTRGPNLNDEHRSAYKEARDQLLRKNADKLGLKHFASEHDERIDEIENLAKQVPEGTQHPLLLQMQEEDNSIDREEANVNAFGSYSGDIETEVDTCVKKYKEIRDQFIEQFGKQ